MTTPPPLPPGQDPYYDPSYQQVPSPYSPAEAYPSHQVSPYPPDAYPHGVEPLTGLPYSDKSKILAGLLQLLPGFVIGLGGLGRLYAGHVTLGVVQLVATAVGWGAVCCGFLTAGLGWLGYVPFWLWFVIDGIVLLSGRPTDGQGRPLRS